MSTTTTRERPILFSGPMVRALLAGTKTQTRRIVKPDAGPLLYDLSRAWVDKGFPCAANGEPMGLNATATPDDYRYQYLKVPFCHRDDGWESDPKDDTIDRIYYPSGPGDRLWVRETWAIDGTGHGGTLSDYRHHIDIAYRADGDNAEAVSWEVDRATYQKFDQMFMAGPDYRLWRPSIFMPRWAARRFPEVASVRVQRVQDISEEDAYAEGIAEWKSADQTFSPRVRFHELWDSINGKRPGCAWKDNCWVWVLTFTPDSQHTPREGEAE